MTRQNSPNYAGLRTALVLGSVAASVLGGRLVTARDAAKYAAQNQDPNPTQDPATDVPTPEAAAPMPTPTPKIIIVYDLPPMPTAITLGGAQPVPQQGQVQVGPALPQVPLPPVVNAGGGGGGGGGNKGGGGAPAPAPKPSGGGKKSKSS